MEKKVEREREGGEGENTKEGKSEEEKKRGRKEREREREKKGPYRGVDNGLDILEDILSRLAGPLNIVLVELVGVLLVLGLGQVALVGGGSGRSAGRC